MYVYQTTTDLPSDRPSTLDLRNRNVADPRPQQPALGKKQVRYCEANEDVLSGYDWEWEWEGGLRYLMSKAVGEGWDWGSDAGLGLGLGFFCCGFFG